MLGRQIMKRETIKVRLARIIGQTKPTYLTIRQLLEMDRQRAASVPREWRELKEECLRETGVGAVCWNQFRKAYFITTFFCRWCYRYFKARS